MKQTLIEIRLMGTHYHNQGKVADNKLQQHKFGWTIITSSARIGIVWWRDLEMNNTKMQ